MQLSAAVLDRATRDRLDALIPAYDGPVAVAVSGGGDSVFALLAAAEWAREAGRAVLALTVDHRLHPASANAAGLVLDLAGRLGVDAKTLTWAEAATGPGLQERARAARHRLLAEACRIAGARALVLGHTLDDQIETVAMRLDRTASARALAGMAAVAPSPAWPEGRALAAVRPFLDRRRADLRAVLADAGAAWVDDAANDDAAFERVRVRARLARLRGQGFDDAGLARIAARAARIDAAERAEAARIAASSVTWLEGAARVVSWRAPGAPASAYPRALEAVLQGAAGRISPVDRGALVRLENALAALLDPTSSLENPSATLGGARLVRDGDGVLVVRDPGGVLGRRDGGAAGLGPVRLEPGEVWDGRFEMTEAATVAPLGGEPQDRLNHVPRSARRTHPVVRDGTGPPRPAAAAFLGPLIARRALFPGRPEFWSVNADLRGFLGETGVSTHLR